MVTELVKKKVFELFFLKQQLLCGILDANVKIEHMIANEPN
jgi:hypothetical protein